MMLQLTVAALIFVVMVVAKKLTMMLQREDPNGHNRFLGDGIGIIARFRRVQARHVELQSWSHEDSEEFKPDMIEKPQFFCSTPFSVSGDDNFGAIASHSGGGGRTDRGVEVGPRQEQESGGDTAGAAGGIRIRRGSNNSTDGGEAAIQILRQEAEIQRLKQELASVVVNMKLMLIVVGVLVSAMIYAL
uniref:Uncharacterized protein n=1 Tax=Lactuca sativa TaxID=4236 RepID=A0A9R1VV31_LACSA|nr:hypothetical protein LSAT_V11C400213800 [Lactuca sativa]